MVPKKIILISSISIILSIVFSLVIGVQLLSALYTFSALDQVTSEQTLMASTSGISTFLIILYSVLLFGEFLLFISAILMLMGKKTGYYMYLVSVLFNTPNLQSIIGWVLFGWFYFSLTLLRDHDDTRAYLNLGDKFFEKPINNPKPKDKPSEFVAGVTTSQTDELAKYVEKTKKEGYSDSSIRTAMLNAGYSNSIIDRYLK